MSDTQTITRDALRGLVLEEIKRIAARDGETPGIQSFARETGITKSRIVGVLWAKWGDALTEAGLAPNGLQSRLDDDHVLNALAVAFQQAGRVLSSNELRFHAGKTDGFPSHSTLDNRFTGRAGMLDRLAEYARDRAEFADVLAMLADRPVAVAKAKVPSAGDGSVYLIKFGPHYKIGRSNDGLRRAREIKTLLPEDGEIIHFITTDDPVGIEAYWHNRFKDLRLRGEWFKLTISDVAAFKRRKFQ
ncbi:GIY-YIG nuclease family protein [Brevundimonas sp.]|uniref:GIY-YIG nuclease family protein n=1 Tax=Brevundimonas sp. TaxID=1871086 RepID=UPI00272FC20D|nr:GIY-YIG nuclease family protein [Brevundimonas sp.]MDP1913816.1 GIY-YIG nuclease family protein [Brevundimonas sp.]